MSDKTKIENKIFNASQTKRSDYTEPLWENDTFISNAFYCLTDPEVIFDIINLIPNEKWGDLLVAHMAIANCLRNHNFIFLDAIYEKIPSFRWSDMGFCGFLVNLHSSAIKYVSKELKMAKEIFYVALEAVPEINDYDEFGYINGFELILNEIPDPLWKDKEFLSEIEKIIRTAYKDKNADFDLEELLSTINKRKSEAKI